MESLTSILKSKLLITVIWISYTKSYPFILTFFRFCDSLQEGP